MTKYQKNEDAKKYEDKYGVDQDDTMLLTDDEFLKAYGYGRGDLVISDDDIARDTYYELLSEKDSLEKRIGEITAEIDETDVMISETRDYVKKAELNQDKRDLLFEEHRLASRLSIVVKQIDELISKKDDGITR